MTKQKDFFDQLQYATEAFLERRREKHFQKKEKHALKMEKYREKINKRIKNPWLQLVVLTAVDWIEAFLWAACVVLLINQYLFQLYQIPSGSMIDTLLIKDRVFVNKLVYGPELLPGFAKLPSPAKPRRNDIIIFENPSYISRGVAFDVLQRVLFMLTLSLVDIDKDESGNPLHHFLIKRAVGVPGDRFVSKNGNMEILFSGEDHWVSEADFNRGRGFNHNITRLTKPGDYKVIEAAGKVIAYNDIRMMPPENLLSLARPLETMDYPDPIALSISRLELLRAAFPGNERYSMELARYRLGNYVPEGRILPLGDNRDNSQDGRWFGPVREAKILGEGVIKFNFDIRRLKLDIGVIR